jgi:hypothetical protein
MKKFIVQIEFKEHKWNMAVYAESAYEAVKEAQSVHGGGTDEHMVYYTVEGKVYV